MINHPNRSKKARNELGVSNLTGVLKGSFRFVKKFRFQSPSGEIATVFAATEAEAREHVPDNWDLCRVRPEPEE
jgi:hypothetical protein